MELLLPVADRDEERVAILAALPRQRQRPAGARPSMTGRVFLHVGLPKTGTTYLQDCLWGNKQALAERGVLLPGRHRRRHLLASLDLRDDPKLRGGPATSRPPGRTW